MRLRRRFRAIWLAPPLALLALAAWAFASPLGASPDDDFHIVSIWCSGVSTSTECAPTEDPALKVLPSGLLELNCYGRDAEASASCQLESVDLDLVDREASARGNFLGEYPRLFYTTMGLFAGPDLLSSGITMRVVNALLAVTLVTSLFLLLPIQRRATLLWPWLVGIVPLGIFLVPSHNPSSWTILGTATAWLALLGWFETQGRRRWGLAALFLVAVLLAAGSRSDGAIYVGFGIFLVLALRFRRSRHYWSDAWLGIVGGLVALAFLLSAQQVGVVTDGFASSAPAPLAGSASSGAPASTPLTGAALLAYNILNLPYLWSGVFGFWGLGWLEIALPPLVAFGALAAFLVFAGASFGQLGKSRALLIGAVGLALIVVPLLILQRGGHGIGQEVQPRYLLPLVMLLIGVLALDAPRRQVMVPRSVRLLIWGAISLANAFALHYTIRRYVTGVDVQGLDLDAGAEWWWPGMLSPMAVWIIGALAFAALAALLLREIGRRDAEFAK